MRVQRELPRDDADKALIRHATGRYLVRQEETEEGRCVIKPEPQRGLTTALLSFLADLVEKSAERVAASDADRPRSLGGAGTGERDGEAAAERRRSADPLACRLDMPSDLVQVVQSYEQGGNVIRVIRLSQVAVETDVPRDLQVQEAIPNEVAGP